MVQTMTEKELLDLFNNINPNVKCSQNVAARRHKGIWEDMNSVSYNTKKAWKGLVLFNKEKLYLDKFKTFKLDIPNSFGNVFITIIDHTEHYDIKDLTKEKAKTMFNEALTDYIKLEKICAIKNKEWDIEKDFT